MKIFREVKGIQDPEAEKSEENVSNSSENDLETDVQAESVSNEAETDNDVPSESDINVSLDKKSED